MVIIATYGLNAYLQSDGKKALDSLIAISGLDIVYDKACISILQDFPEVTVVMEGLEISPDPESPQQKVESRSIEMRGRITDWRKRYLQISSVLMKEGKVTLELESEEGIIARVQEWVSHLRTNAKSRPHGDSPAVIDVLDLDIRLADIDLEISQESRGLYADAYIHGLDMTYPNSSGGRIVLDTELDVEIDTLRFSDSSGDYLTGAHLIGEPVVILDSSMVVIDDFDLRIDEHLFTVNASIDSDAPAITKLELSNAATQLEGILPLLPEKIRNAIKPYKIVGHIPTKTHLLFRTGSRAIVDVQFSIDKQPVNVRGMAIQSASLDGRYVNTTTDRNNDCSPRGFRLILEDIVIDDSGLEIDSDYAIISGGPGQPADISTRFIANGKAAKVSEWYESDQFIFTKGDFSLSADVEGPIKNLMGLVSSGVVNLTMTDTEVLYVPSEAVIPFREVRLEKYDKRASFTILGTTLRNEHHYEIDGNISDVSLLLESDPALSATTNVNIRAPHIGWEDYVGIFSKRQNGNRVKQGELQAKQSMKKTMLGIEKKFGPKVKLDIDTFSYYDIIDLYAIDASVSFDNRRNLILDVDNLEVDQGKVSFLSTLDISDNTQTHFDLELSANDINPSDLLKKVDYFDMAIFNSIDSLPEHVNLSVGVNGLMHDVDGIVPYTTAGTLEYESPLDNLNGTLSFEPLSLYPSKGEENSKVEKVYSSRLDLSGSPHLFNEFFDNENFFFQDTGMFITAFQYEGDMNNIYQLIEESSVNLYLKNAAVYSREIDFVFPLNDLSLDLVQDTANFKLYMSSDILEREINVEGSINHLTEMIFSDNKKELSTVVRATSPIINLSHALAVFGSENKENTYISPAALEWKMKGLVLSLMGRFDPDLTVVMDTFVITDKFAFTDFVTGAHMHGDSVFVLEQTDFEFDGSDISVDADVDLSDRKEIPFDAHFSAARLDMENLLDALNYFNSDQIKSAQQLSGKVTLDLDFKGSLRDLRLVEPRTDASVDFTIEELKVQGLDVVDEVAARIGMTERLSNIQFGPIDNKVSILGSHIHIPLMEVQSDAFDFFMEGFIDERGGLGENMADLWLSFPLDNIKGRELGVIPPNRGWPATSNKVHLHLTQNKDGVISTKFRLRKRKFYKDRDRLDEYKEGKTLNRKWRKDNKN